MHLFLKLFILVKHSTCFRRSFCPSSGAQDCTYSNTRMSNSCCYLLLLGMSSSSFPLAGIKEKTDRHAITTKDQQNWNCNENLGVKETRVCPTNVSFFTMFIPCIVTLLLQRGTSQMHTCYNLILQSTFCMFQALKGHHQEVNCKDTGIMV
jgi:hypothetical protein